MANLTYEEKSRFNNQSFRECFFDVTLKMNKKYAEMVAKADDKQVVQLGICNAAMEVIREAEMLNEYVEYAKAHC